MASFSDWPVRSWLLMVAWAMTVYSARDSSPPGTSPTIRQSLSGPSRK